MLVEARRLMRSRTAIDRQKLMRLQSELRKVDEGLIRLYEAIEGGFLSLDELTAAQTPASVRQQEKAC